MGGVFAQTGSPFILFPELRRLLTSLTEPKWYVTFACTLEFSWHSWIIFTARKRSLRRLCFYRCLSVHMGGRAWLLGGAWLLWGGVHGFFWGVGACMVFPGGCTWFFPGGMRGCSRGLGGHVWLLLGGVWFFLGGAWFFPGGMHGFFLGEGMRRIRRDTVNERAVRILLECILVGIDFPFGQTLSSERVLGRHVRCECMCLYWELKCKE